MEKIIETVKTEITTDLKDQYGTCKRLGLSVSEKELEQKLQMVSAIKDENDILILNAKMSQLLNPKMVPLLDQVLGIVKANENREFFFQLDIFKEAVGLSQYGGDYEDFIKSWSFSSSKTCTDYGQFFEPLKFSDQLIETAPEIHDVSNLLVYFEIDSDGRSIDDTKCIILFSLTSGMMVPKYWDFPVMNLN